MKNIKNICVVTGSRAEYGLLSNLMISLKANNFFKLQIVVTGTHLSLEHDLTYKEIINDGFKIDKKIDLKIAKNNPSGIASQMSLALIGFSNVYSHLKPDLIIILGDRYEIFCSAIAATLFNIPIAHIHGGEVTKGSIDNSFRHSITKMSDIHFVATKKAKLRIIQLGENKNNIYHVGSLGVENIKKIKFLTKNVIGKRLNINLKEKLFLVTFHPETLSNKSVDKQIDPLLDALTEINNINILFTMSNSDVGGNIINKKISSFVKKNKNAYLIKNLGHVNYLSIMKHSAAVVGNSSSGIIEAPSLNIFSINIGDRQNGREFASSVINCKNTKDHILKATNYILNSKNKTKQLKLPYEKKNTSRAITNILKKVCLNEIKIKQFIDMKI